MEIIENDRGVFGLIWLTRVASIFFQGNLASKSKIEPSGVGGENV